MEFVWIEPGSYLMGTSESQKTEMDRLNFQRGPTSRRCRAGDRIGGRVRSVHLTNRW